MHQVWSFHLVVWQTTAKKGTNLKSASEGRTKVLIFLCMQICNALIAFAIILLLLSVLHASASEDTFLWKKHFAFFFSFFGLRTPRSNISVTMFPRWMGTLGQLHTIKPNCCFHLFHRRSITVSLETKNQFAFDQVFLNNKFWLDTCIVFAGV